MRLISAELTFKKELSNLEVRGIEHLLTELYEDEIFYSPIDLGLAYTSSSSYAAHNVCDGEFRHDDKIISHFAVTCNNMLIMVCHDDEEVYYYYEVTN
ncbi:hypothetical protein QTG56_25395 (plasmid) [Rossellomorea sp. AcN35-11]|nr:hypothetical protein [Rossellomorea aquimaris]WJV31952.1 hypothetical protein QTG56_25395 [Rossellomorea sp. AcN35-11]